LFVSLLAGPVLGESVGPWRIFALLVGAVGAAFILSPWQDDFSAVQLLPILAGFFYATNILTLRRACRKESPLALAFAVGVVFIVSGVAGIVLLSWFPLSAEIRETIPFVAIGWPELTFLVAGFALFASVLNFSYLIFAALWSRVIFDQWPTSQALIGMGLIGAAGVITAWRERVIATGKRISL
jgi:drug/metabolite transporter (DMT)-like permease